MDDHYPIGFVRHKVELAKRLSAGECGGSYGDAILILSSAISALASELFPRSSMPIDRKRFVQLWARYADLALSPVNVSVPLLAQAAYKDADTASVEGLRNLRPEVFSSFPAAADGLVLSGGRADVTEADVRRACPHLALRTIRQNTYPWLFYTHIRSGFVHEGDTTELGSSHPGSTRPADISYANVINPPYRRIYFDIHWLGRVAESIARNAAADVYKPRQPLPKTWWESGGAA